MVKLTDEQRIELAELRARNLEELAELREDIERRKKFTILESHRPEPKPEKKGMFSDDTVARITEALKQEIQAQLRDHHGYLRALIEESYLDLHKSAKGMKKDIATLRRELAELRTDAAEAKALASGSNVELITKRTKAKERA